jgi:hypothetical protein
VRCSGVATALRGGTFGTACARPTRSCPSPARHSPCSSREPAAHPRRQAEPPRRSSRMTVRPTAGHASGWIVRGRPGARPASRGTTRSAAFRRACAAAPRRSSAAPAAPPSVSRARTASRSARQIRRTNRSGNAGGRRLQSVSVRRPWRGSAQATTRPETHPSPGWPLRAPVVSYTSCQHARRFMDEARSLLPPRARGEDSLDPRPSFRRRGCSRARGPSPCPQAPCSSPPLRGARRPPQRRQCQRWHPLARPSTRPATPRSPACPRTARAGIHDLPR